MPEDIVNILIGRLVGMLQKHTNRKDGLGHCSTFRLEGNNKMKQVINVCQITESVALRILKSMTQHDRSARMVKKVY